MASFFLKIFFSRIKDMLFKILVFLIEAVEEVIFGGIQ
jgi:hypothetical protein